MLANPGGVVTGDAIIGREVEIAEIWRKLKTRSVVLTAERRVGKTSLIRKLTDHPKDGWVPLFCFVESVSHPIDCVQLIFSEASKQDLGTRKGKWLHRFRQAYQAASKATAAGWQLPEIREAWKGWLGSLIEDIVENTDQRVLIALDEFPLMVSKFRDQHQPACAMEFLDTLRELRQRFESTGRFRLLLSGSIGLHLIVHELKNSHGYRNNPTNDMAIEILSGMSPEDTRLMCQRYLEEEGIEREDAEGFDEVMHTLTDGLPLYIQHVCSSFQSGSAKKVTAADVERVLREMMDSTEVEWFRDAAERIDTRYRSFGGDELASTILNALSQTPGFVPETEIVEHVRRRVAVDHDSDVVRMLEILRMDNYVVRDTSTGQRRYRFRYRLMREWWRINRA